MENYIILLAIVWVVIALIVGSFGDERKIGFFGAAFASLLLSPILAMLFVLASDKKTESIKYSAPVKPNYLKEEISGDKLFATLIVENLSGQTLIVNVSGASIDERILHNEQKTTFKINGGLTNCVAEYADTNELYKAESLYLKRGQTTTLTWK